MVTSTGGSGIIAGLGAIRQGNTYGSATNLDKMAYVEVGPGDAAAAAKLPGISTYYTSGSQVVYNDEWNAGVWYSIAKANGWLLHDLSGNEIYYGSGGNGRLTNPGLLGFQQEWVKEMTAYLQSTGADGVFIDNFGVWPPVNGSPWNIKEISNQAAYQAAQLSFIKYVGGALKAEGYYVMVNGMAYIPGDNGSDDGTLSKAWIDQIYPYINGYFVEYWQENGSDFRLRGLGVEWYNHWDAWQSVMAYAQSKGLDFHGEVEAGATDLQEDRYVRASFLLEWNGGGGSFMPSPTSASDNWNNVLAINPGLPSAAKTQIATNIWRRDYTNGVVVVNPTASTVTVSLSGGPYYYPDGTSVPSSVTIGPTDALIFRR
jgi:hypothetical protein